MIVGEFMFNKKYFILVFFVFLIAITSVSAQDDAVASQDLNELSFNDNVVLDTNTDAEHYADGGVRQDTGQTADDLINLSECSSAVLQVSDNEGVICVRRDAANAADIYIESGSWGDIGYLKQYKTSGGYFSHAIVTSNGWLIGNGGVTDGSVFRQIESIASEMVVTNQITNDYLSRIYKIISRYSLGHFVIKAADGTYGVVFSNLYHVSKLQPGQYVLCPNVYSMSQKGSYDSSLNPVDAAIKKVYTDSYGVNRRNIMTYHWKLTASSDGLSYGVDSYASNDDGRGVGRSTSNMADNVYYFSNFHSRNSIPLARGQFFNINDTFQTVIPVCFHMLIMTVKSAEPCNNLIFREEIGITEPIRSNCIIKYQRFTCCNCRFTFCILIERNQFLRYHGKCLLRTVVIFYCQT